MLTLVLGTVVGSVENILAKSAYASILISKAPRKVCLGPTNSPWCGLVQSIQELTKTPTTDSEQFAWGQPAQSCASPTTSATQSAVQSFCPPPRAACRGSAGHKRRTDFPGLFLAAARQLSLHGPEAALASDLRDLTTFFLCSTTSAPMLTKTVIIISRVPSERAACWNCCHVVALVILRS